MKDTIADFSMRPMRYTNIDGTQEMTVGIVSLVLGLTQYLEPRHAGITVTLVIIPVILLLPLYFVWRGVRAIKNRVTYPRTGYAEPLQHTSRVLVFSVIAFIVGIALAVLLVGFANQRGVLSVPVQRLLLVPLLGKLAFCAGVAVAYALFLVRFNNRERWKWLVALFITLGLVSIALGVPGSFAVFGELALLFIGLVQLASGGLTLYLYIRRAEHPRSGAE